MAVNLNEVTVGERYPALSIGSDKVPVDSSCDSELLYVYQTSTSAVSQGSGEDPAFNGIEAIFDIEVPAGMYVVFEKSFLKVTGYAADMSVSKTTPVPLGVSIPWNSIAALLQSVDLQFNSSGTSVENISQNLGDGSMVKFLTRYTREAIEAMQDSMFTPCFESSRDLKNGGTSGTNLSVESQARRLAQLVEPELDTQIVHCKNLYLCDIFDSLRIPAAMYLRKFQIKVRPKVSTDILIVDVGHVGSTDAPKQKYFVTNMSMSVTMCKLTDEQMKVEIPRIQSNSAMLYQSFYTYDTNQRSFSQGSSFRDSGIKNMQASVFMFPSSSAADGLGCNPYQYTYGSAALGATGVSGYQMKYSTIYSPSQILAVSNVNHHLNSDLYAQYRMLCRKMSEREITPAIKMEDMVGIRTNVEDVSYYTLFCSTFYPMAAYGHRTAAGADHEIMISGGATEPIVIVRIRLSFLRVMSDLSVDVFL